MDSFATYDDLAMITDIPSDMTEERVEALLERASRKIANRIEGKVSPDAETLRDVTVDVVRRAIGPNGGLGVASQSMTAGSYTEQLTYSNPESNLYISKENLRDLGLRKATMGMIHPWENR